MNNQVFHRDNNLLQQEQTAPMFPYGLLTIYSFTEDC
jgi:hypothetical protein